MSNIVGDVHITVPITKGDIESILISAAQSGDWSWDGSIISPICEGKRVTIIDTITEEEHRLDLDMLLAGIELFIIDWKVSFSDYFGDDATSMDAVSAPAILQYTIFKEQVYS